MNTSHIVKRKININSMWISCKFPDGSMFKYTVMRHGTDLTIDLKNVPIPIEDQRQIMLDWLELNYTWSYNNLFDKLSGISVRCHTGRQFILSIKLKEKLLCPQKQN